MQQTPAVSAKHDCVAAPATSADMDTGYVRIDRDTYAALLADLQQHETLCLVLHDEFERLLHHLTPDQFRDLLAISSSGALDMRCKLADAVRPAL